MENPEKARTVSKDDDMIVTGYCCCLSGLAYVVIMAVLTMVCSGWATSVLWRWFVVPAFELPSISMAQAIGLRSVLYGLLPLPAAKRPGGKKSEEKRILSQGEITETATELHQAVEWSKKSLLLCIKLFLSATVLPLSSVGLGWIVLQFV